MRKLSLCTALLLVLAGSAQAESFSYRGQLDDGGRPATGSYRLKLTLYADADGRQQLAVPVMLDSVAVQNGRFAVTVDFPELPALAHSGWLEVAVMSATDGDFWPLPDRQQVALKSLNCSENWTVTGNPSTDAALNFLGTTDSQPLVLRTANVQSLRIEPSALLFGGLPVTANVIAGSHTNTVTAGVRGATIAGGGAPIGDSEPYFGEEAPNVVTDAYGTVGGGYGNRAGDDAGVVLDHPFATVGGGINNVASSTSSTVGGGESNTASRFFSTVGGGFNNIASRNGSTIGGGEGNTASGEDSIVSGGYANSASGSFSTIGGGLSNVTSGDGSSVPGGFNNCAGGTASWAGGHGASVRPGLDPGGAGSCSGLSYPGGAGDAGTFVWADSQGSNFVSTGPNQFLVRAEGGAGFNTSALSPGTDLAVASRSPGANVDILLRPADTTWGINFAAFGSASSAGLYIARSNGSSYVDYAVWQADGRLRVFYDNPIKPTAGGWASPSDARLKQDIEPLSNALDRLLALQGVEFAYRDDAPLGYHVPGRHAGFVAQAVETVFPDWVSYDQAGYRLVAPKGFEALTIEALRELRAEGDATLIQLRTENAVLRDELGVLRGEIANLRRVLLGVTTVGAR